MDTSIRSLLDELYQSDPSLQAREAEIIKIIEKLRASKPSANIDQTFRRELRARLLKKTSDTSLVRTFPMGLRWAIPAGAAAALVIGILVYSQSPSSTTDNQVAIKNAGNRAFGELKVSDSTPATARSQAGGETTETAPISDQQIKIAPAPNPDYAYPIYSFDGKLDIPNASVLRRDNELGDNISSLISSANVPGLSLSSFKNLSVDQVTFSETNGTYLITLDRKYGQISIVRNYADGDVKIMADDRPVENRTVASLPPDPELIKAAQNFLNAHGISHDGLGEPIVRKDWQIYALAEMTTYPAPSDVSVVFPWKMNGLPVYEDGGQPYGLTVNVHVADKTVSSVTNIVPLQFTSSSYELATDSSELRAVIRRGGIYMSEPPAGAKTQSIPLGAPTAGYVVSRFQLDARGTEYLVPALIFPINQTNQATTGRTSVVVPVVVDLLETATTSSGAGSAVDGSAGSVPSIR